MALTAGALSQVAVSDVAAQLVSAVATSGTAPYTYQWYRSTTSGFTPGGGNILTGFTALSITDTGLTPGTKYYYKVVVTDAAAATATSAQLEVDTLALQVSPNQFSETPFLGMLDLRYSPNTISVMFDPSGSGSLVAGQAVKWSTTASGIPMVVPSLATSDVVAGFVNYDIKSKLYVPGDSLEMSDQLNVMFLMAAAAINRGQEVTSLPAAVAGGCNGGVIPAVPSGGLPKVGYSLDTVASGKLVRIALRTPANILS